MQAVKVSWVSETAPGSHCPGVHLVLVYIAPVLVHILICRMSALFVAIDVLVIPSTMFFFGWELEIKSLISGRRPVFCIALMFIIYVLVFACNVSVCGALFRV